MAVIGYDRFPRDSSRYDNNFSLHFLLPKASNSIAGNRTLPRYSHYESSLVASVITLMQIASHISVPPKYPAIKTLQKPNRVCIWDRGYFRKKTKAAPVKKTMTHPNMAFGLACFGTVYQHCGYANCPTGYWRKDDLRRTNLLKTKKGPPEGDPF